MTEQTTILTGPQERNLMRFYLCGEFGEHRWSSIRVLGEEGFIDLSGKAVTLTEKGRNYCQRLAES